MRLVERESDNCSMELGGGRFPEPALTGLEIPVWHGQGQDTKIWPCPLQLFTNRAPIYCVSVRFETLTANSFR